MKTSPRHRISVVFSWIILLTAVVVCTSPALAAETLCIVFRDDISMHHQLAEKLKTATQQNDSTAAVELFPLSKDWKPESQKRLLKRNPTKFLAIGDVALSFCVETAPDIPGIYFMLATKQLVRKVAGSWQWEGTKVWVEPEIQFELIRKLMPGIRTVGMVLTPTCKDCGERFITAAKKYGLKLKYTQTEERQEIIPAIRKVFQQSDAYLLLPDPNLLNNITIQELLRLQTELHRPLIGPAMPFVRMGAMISINYKLDPLVQYIAKNINSNIDPDEKWQEISDCCVEVSINRKVKEQLDIHIKTEELQSRLNIIEPEVEK